MDMDDQDYWDDLERQGKLLHSRLKELFESGQVRLHTDPLRIPNTPEAKLAQYLHLLQTRHHLFRVPSNDEEKARRNRVIRAFCIKPENFPERFFEARRERDLKLGLGQVQLSGNRQQQLIDAIVTDQQKRLKQWVKFLNSPEANFPIWFRFYVLSNIVKIREYDTKNESFPRRTPKSSTANFPELNKQVISDMFRYITDPEFVTQKQTERAQKFLRLENRDSYEDLPPVDANFARLYEFFTKDFLLDVMDSRRVLTDGKWETFERDSLGTEVASVLSGHNTGWCSANFGQAQDQLRKGDVYIYFTADVNLEFKIPRILIRMEDERVKEVRGRLPDQEIEPELVEIANERLELLNGGNRYFRVVQDMNRLTDVIARDDKGERLTREDLIFIYQIEKPIIGFGTKVDPRLPALRETRDARKDLAYIFGCLPENVALTPLELTQTTEVCGFSIDHKTKLDEIEYKRVVAVAGNVNLERIGTSFPSLTFVSGDLRLKLPHENISIVRGLIQYVNANEGLPNLVLVGGSAMFSSTKGEFPKLEHIGGSLHATHSRTSFPSLRKIEGDARLDGAKIEWLPDELIVGGDIIGAVPPTRSAFSQRLEPR